MELGLGSSTTPLQTQLLELYLGVGAGFKQALLAQNQETFAQPEKSLTTPKNLLDETQNSNNAHTGFGNECLYIFSVTHTQLKQTSTWLI